MLKPFFVLAMQSHSRQLTFRRVVVGHCLLISILGFMASRATTADQLTSLGYVLLCLGIVEGAALVGWRLTQIPKSQALEFLLTSPIQPRRLFLAEALASMSRFVLVQIAGLPILGGLVVSGVYLPEDLLLLWFMPCLWGLVAGSAITAWVYEPELVRKIGEVCAMIGIFIYLVVGVIAAENLLLWLQQMPAWLGKIIYDCVRFLHDYNPFGMVKYWLANDRVEWIAWQRFYLVHSFGFLFFLGATLRAAFRLQGHFHSRHYKPIDSSRACQVDRIGDQPLAWWAVRRVMEYSGKVNLWLAGGFCFVYAAFLIAGDSWPSWMGKLVFQLFENWGGPAAVATACVVLATVPAVFQFGLWDATTADRCRRLELLLLTELNEHDYWRASLAASWRRGRGYFVAALFLWIALGVSGRNSWPEVCASMCAAALIWAFSFALGFRAFSTGAQTSVLSSLMVLGLPLVFAGLVKFGYGSLGNFLPVGLIYLPLSEGLGLPWYLAFLLLSGGTVWLTRYGLAGCDAGLRRWYDANQGAATAEAS